MNASFIVPAIVATKLTLSVKVQQLWRDAVWTVKQGQEKFLGAYEATIDEHIPGWRDNWKTDPHFPSRLAVIEAQIKDICRANGMPVPTFNRYRTAARKSLLMGVPFKFASSEILQIAPSRTSYASGRR